MEWVERIAMAAASEESESLEVMTGNFGLQALCNDAAHRRHRCCPHVTLFAVRAAKRLAGRRKKCPFRQRPSSHRRLVRLLK